MIQDDEGNESLEQLQGSIRGIKGTFDSVYKLVELSRELLGGDEVDDDKLNEMRVVQRDFIMDSFRVNKLHKDFKRWEMETNQGFLERVVKVYNEKYGRMSRVNFDLEKLESDWEGLRASVKLPGFSFSIKTLQKYKGGELLKYVKKIEGGDEYPSLIELNTIFSFGLDQELPVIDYKTFNRLVNIEFGLRVQAGLKYELLWAVKQQLTTKNKRWSSRDAELNHFMANTLNTVIKDVEKIRESEYEDLKAYDGDLQDQDLEIDEEEEGESDHSMDQVEEDGLVGIEYENSSETEDNENLNKVQDDGGVTDNTATFNEGDKNVEDENTLKSADNFSNGDNVPMDESPEDQEMEGIAQADQVENLQNKDLEDPGTTNSVPDEKTEHNGSDSNMSMEE